MRFEEEVLAALGTRADAALRPERVGSENFEPLKQVVFDYWGRNTAGALERIKATAGQKAFVWGGESPRDPPQLAASLILAGYEKVVFIDRLSHLLGRDDMISTRLILDRPANSVYKAKFLSEAISTQLRVLRRLRPFIEAGFVELLPPPIFWTNDAVGTIEAAAALDFKNPDHKSVFQKGLPYAGHSRPLGYAEIGKLFAEYDSSVKRLSYLRSHADRPAALMRGPLEELNEALFGRGILAGSELCSVDLVTDRERHWDWLEWKLGEDCAAQRRNFGSMQATWIQGMDPEAVIAAHRDGALDSIRHFFRVELPLLYSSPDQLKELERTWPAARRRIEAELASLRRNYRHRFGRRLGLVGLTLGLAAPGAFSFPEWLAFTTPVVSAALGFSVRDILGLRTEYLKEASQLLSSKPVYLLFRVDSRSNPRDLVPGID